MSNVITMFFQVIFLPPPNSVFYFLFKIENFPDFCFKLKKLTVNKFYLLYLRNYLKLNEYFILINFNPQVN